MGAPPEKWSFHDQIRHNNRVTVVVVGVMLVLLFSVIFLVGLILDTPPAFTFVLALVVTGIYLAITWSQSVKMILWSADARPARDDVREEKLLKYRVEEMAIAAGLPVPKVYVQDSVDINAFAAGKTPEEAVICVTTGALKLLDQEELEGVMAHEMSHILNRDVRLATITIAVAGAIAMLAEIAVRSLWFSGGGRKKNVPPALVILALVLLILAPILSRLVYLMLSRRREYLADATGARLTRNPEGLAQALLKIKGDLPDQPKGSRTLAGLYIANPWNRLQAASVFATHPPIDERVRRLRSM